MRTVSKGVTIVGFTQDQVKAHKIITLKGSGIDLVVDDSFNPNEYSIEEAVVIATDPNQSEFKEGDSVLIDFAVFTAGKQPQFENIPGTRLIGREGDYDCYWLVDPLHPVDLAEIYAKITDDGKVIPIGDAVFIYPDTNTELYVKNSEMYIPSINRFLNPFVAKVFAAPPGSEIHEGDEILCEPGFNIRIKYRGIEMEYVNYPYIIGRMISDQLQLF